MRTDDVDAGFGAIFFHIAGSAEDNRFRIFDLSPDRILRSFGVQSAFLASATVTKLLSVIGRSASAPRTARMTSDNLSATGRFDEDSVRRELFRYAAKGLSKITYQRTADTAGAHLGNFTPASFKIRCRY